MKRFLLLTMMCALGLFGQIKAQKTTISALPENLLLVEVGSDNNPTTTTYNIPVADWTSYSISQQIYLEEELLNVGKIYSVAFKQGMNRNNPDTRQYEVYMKHVDVDAFDGSYLALSSSDKVFDGDVVITGTKDTWCTIELDTPFDYTGGNLLLAVYDKSGISTSYHTSYKYDVATQRSMYSTGTSTFDMTNLTISGTTAACVNYIQLQMEVEADVEVSAETLAFGRVAVGCWTGKSQQISITPVCTTVSSIVSDNAFFVLPTDIDYAARPIVVDVTYDKNAEAGEKAGNLVITYGDGATKVVPMTATAYTTVEPDVFELATEVEFTSFTYTDTPEFTSLNDNYSLPKEVNAGNTPDAVYAFELDEELLVTANVTGTNAVAAIYREDFDGKEGPASDNSYQGNIPLPTTFFYNFDDNSMEHFTLIDADGDGQCWEASNNCAMSYSWKLGVGAMSPDNYFLTKEQYAIKNSSKLTFDVRAVNNSPDYYSVVISDGTNHTAIFEESYSSSTVKSVEIDLSAHAGKNVYIGIRHFNCSNQYYIAIDNFCLDDGTRSRGTDPQINAVPYPAGKYYLVAAAEDAFSVNITLGALPGAPPAAPSNLVATVTGISTVELEWDEVIGATSYRVYNGAELIAEDLTATAYTVENLEPYTEYCFRVTAYNGESESEKSTKACVETFDLPIEAPKVTMTAIDPYSLNITWETVENAMSYNVYQGSILLINTTETAYFVEDLLPKTEYCYEVSAVRNETETEKTLACGYTAAIDFESEDLATEFLFDFNDQTFDGLRLIDADGDGKNWGISLQQNSLDETYAIRSYSAYYGTLTPDNFVITKSAYRIKRTSVVTLNAKSGTGQDEDLGEHYAVVVSENGNDWTVVFEETIENHDWTNTSVSLAEYAGKNVLLGVRHYDCSGHYFLAVDNFALTVLGPDVPAAPFITATVEDGSIYVSWPAVEGATFYTLYYNGNKVQDITDGNSIYVNVPTPGRYCFTVTASNEEGESEHSNEDCATIEADPDLEVPAAPVLEAEIVNDSVVLTWTAVERATYYTVYFAGDKLSSIDKLEVRLGLEGYGRYCFTVTASNLSGESKHSNEACVEYTDAIEENVVAFNIYPNPVENEIIVSSEEIIEEITIYNVLGTMVYAEQCTTNNVRLNVSDLSSGVYFVKLRTANAETVSRIVKK